MNGKDWHDNIKWLLDRRGTSLSQIARELEVSPSTVTRVSKGLVRSRRVEEAISSATGLTPAQLWPGHSANNAGADA